MLTEGEAGTCALISKVGIQSSTCTQFRIGYAPPEWDGLTKAMLKEGFTAGSCGRRPPFRVIKAVRRRQGVRAL